MSLNHTELIVPMVLIPFTMVSVALSVVATFIAGLFGIQLKFEGPKKLLELLLNKKVLLASLATSLISLAGVQGWNYVKNLPSFMWRIQHINQGYNIVARDNVQYLDSFGRINEFETTKTAKDVQVPKNISVVWTKKLDSGVFRDPVYSGGSYLLNSLDKHVYELNPKNGDTIRRWRIGAMGTPAPIIFKNNLYVGEGVHDTHHARIYKINLHSGKIESFFETKGHTEGQPQLATYKDKTYLLVSSGGDGVYALDPETMKAIWHVNDGHIDSSVKVENGIMYSGTGREKGNAEKFRSYAIAYELDTGKRIWKRELPASSWMTPVVSGEKVCFVQGEIYFETDFGGFACFDKIKGTPLFILNTTDPIFGIPVVVNKKVYLTGVKGIVCRADLDKRGFDWCTETKKAKKSYTPVSYDPYHHLIVYPSLDDGLYVFDPDTGKTLYHYQDKNWKTVYSGVTITEDGWVVADMKGRVQLLKPEF